MIAIPRAVLLPAIAAVVAVTTEGPAALGTRSYRCGRGWMWSKVKSYQIVLGVTFLLVTVLAVCFAIYRINYPTYTYRYRMAVTIEVDGETRSGSSVIEVNVRKNPSPMFERRVLLESVQGEAAFVPIGEHSFLVALLASGLYGEDVDYPTRIVPLAFKLDTFDESVRERLPNLRGQRDLSGKLLPTLVLASDPTDSATLRVIRPDEFDQTFGPGVRLRGVTIEMTTDAVTHGIEERLPFLIAEKKRLYHLYSYPNVFTPHYSSFVRSF